MAESEHGLQRYRRGCRCDVCKAASSAWMREYRAKKRGLDAPPPQPNVTVLPTPVVVEDVEPGPNEQAVLDEIASLSAAARRPSSVESALTLARGLDNGKLATQHAAMVRQKELVMESLRNSSAGDRRGRLASVAQASQRRASKSVG